MSWVIGNLENALNTWNDVCCKGWLSRPLLLQWQVGSLVAD
ncbi:MAG: hypothetical protein PHR14_11010 [Oscillospiraceae bacterium]|nr:hypothetical protein [Oscillospiraceae bacterium]